MVYFVTGPRDSGKTTAMQRLFHQRGVGDGILSHKTFKDGSVCGYELERLSTGIRVPLAVRHSLITPDWDGEYLQGSFSFSRSGLQFARSAIDEIIAKNTSPLFIDELGPMELKGSGLTNAHKAFDYDREVYIAVRDRYLSRIVERYAIQHYEIIEVNGRAQD